MTTCSTWSGGTAERSSAPAMAIAPSLVAGTVASAPPSLPIGVRALPRITVLGICSRSSRPLERAVPRSLLSLAGHSGGPCMLANA